MFLIQSYNFLFFSIELCLDLNYVWTLDYNWKIYVLVFENAYSFFNIYKKSIPKPGIVPK